MDGYTSPPITPEIALIPPLNAKSADPLAPNFAPITTPKGQTATPVISQAPLSVIQGISVTPLTIPLEDKQTETHLGIEVTPLDILYAAVEITGTSSDPLPLELGNYSSLLGIEVPVIDLTWDTIINVQSTRTLPFRSQIQNQHQIVYATPTNATFSAPFNSQINSNHAALFISQINGKFSTGLGINTYSNFQAKIKSQISKTTALPIVTKIAATLITPLISRIELIKKIPFVCSTNYTHNFLFSGEQQVNQQLTLPFSIQKETQITSTFTIPLQTTISGKLLIKFSSERQITSQFTTSFEESKPVTSQITLPFSAPEHTHITTSFKLTVIST
jgi:hypothetical protein